MKVTNVNNSIEIGPYSVLRTLNLLIPEGNTAKFLLDAEDGDSPLEIEVEFNRDESEEKKKRSAIRLKGEGKKGIITFVNWDSSVSVGFKEPINFGKTNDNKKIYFIAKVSKSQGLHEATLQFMKTREEVNEI